MADRTTRGVSYIRTGLSTRSQSGAAMRISAQRVTAYCELHRVSLDATLLDKGMVTQGEQGEHRERPTVLDEALGMLRLEGPTLLIVPSMAHLALSVGKLAQLVEQHFGNGTFALVAVAEGVDTRTDNGRFVLGLLRTLARWECEGAYHADS
jgi:DNA invertase Pin-like site-specific DNA recombinase